MTSATWPRVRLGELATTVGSGATPRGGEAAYKNSGIPLIRSKNVVFFGFKREGIAYLDEKQAQALQGVEVRTNDVLLNITGASIGRVALAPQDMNGARVSQHVCIIRPSETVDARFLRAFLSGPEMQSEITAENYGVTRQALTKQQILDFEVPLPPLNEQKRIADRLDAVLARVDACRERLDRIPSILKRFRQSVLAAATTGKLSDDWRQEQDCSEAWKGGTLESLLDGKPRNGYSPRSVEHETSVKSLTLSATTAGRFRPEHFKFIDEEIPATSHLWLQPGDILVQRANTMEYVGVSAVYDGPPAGFIYPDLMMKTRANDRVEPKFLHYLLLSAPVRRHFRDNATGTAGNMPKINQQTVLTAPVAWPSRVEQAEIVRRVEILFACADSLEARYTAARGQVDRLTPALLAKAFRGELVPQDPNDEPASVLLQRIRAAHAAAPAKPPGRERASRSDKLQKVEVTMLNRRDIQGSHLSAILKEGGSLTAEALWSTSQLNIDDFYDQLKDEESRGLLKERRGESPTAPRMLEAVA